jgi:Holliday junction resolvase RusA-like endonuclease
MEIDHLYSYATYNLLKERMPFTFIIPGDPIPLARPRLGKGHVYDSQAELKLVVGWELRNQQWEMETLGFDDGPLKISFEFGMRMPKMSVKKKLGIIDRPHIKRPDLSNLIKFYEDAALGILYKDDSIIAEISAKKIYVEEPYTKMEIELL